MWIFWNGPNCVWICLARREGNCDTNAPSFGKKKSVIVGDIKAPLSRVSGIRRSNTYVEDCQEVGHPDGHPVGPDTDRDQGSAEDETGPFTLASCP